MLERQSLDKAREDPNKHQSGSLFSGLYSAFLAWIKSASQTTMRGLFTSTLAAAALSCASATCSKTKTDSLVFSNSTGYDYIVVGGGPSGIVAATRLAQAFSNKTVLLLSRGPGPTINTGASLTVGWNDSLTPIDVPGLSTAVALYERGNETLFSSYLCPDAPNVYAACVLGGGATVNCK